MSQIHPRIRPYVEAAMKELREKSLGQVQVETALKWCGRACAAMSLGRREDAHEYAHEALEHAALTGYDDLLWHIREALASCGIEP